MKIRTSSGEDIDLLTTKDLRSELEDYYNRSRPIAKYLVDAGITPVGVELVFDLGCPAKGRVWDLRHITISGTAAFTVVAGTAVFCVGQVPQLATSVPALDVFDAAAAIPASGFYSKNQVIIQGADHLYVVTNGVPDATTLVTRALVIEKILGVELGDDL